VAGELDIAGTLKFFNRWFADHKKACGVGGVSVVAIPSASAVMTVTLTCPVCSGSISGSIVQGDLTRISHLLDTSRAN
jgi:hypothetical protein